MRWIFIICITCFAFSNVQAQRSETQHLDSLIARFDRRELTGRAGKVAIDSFRAIYRRNPSNALAALYLARAFGDFTIGTGNATSPQHGLAMIDSELHYTMLARSLDPQIRERHFNFSIPMMMGHIAGGRALWHIYLTDTVNAEEDLRAGVQNGAFSKSLLELARMTLDALPHGAIYFTWGDDDTFPIWYLQLVDGLRRDVSVVNLSLLAMPWYGQVVGKGVANWITATPFEQAKDTNDKRNDDPFTSKLDIDILYSNNADLDSSGKANVRLVYPIAPSAHKEIEEAVGHKVSNEPVIQALHASERELADLPNLAVSAEIFKRIVRANEWRRPIYFAATGPLDAFAGIEPFVRFEGFASRLLPDTGKEFDTIAHAWVDSAKYLNALQKAISFFPTADSFTRKDLIDDFLLSPFQAFTARLDSSHLDKIIENLRPMIRSESYGLVSAYSTVVITAYSQNHSALKTDVEWIATTMGAELLAKKRDNDWAKWTYACSLYVLKRCDDLSKFYTTVRRSQERSASKGYDIAGSIKQLVSACK